MRESFNNRSYLKNLDEEAEAQAAFVGSADNVEGVMAFVEKRNQISKAANTTIETFQNLILKKCLLLRNIPT